MVLSANPSDTHLDHEGLIHAITQRVFIAYSAIYIVGAIILSGLSESNIGKRYVFVDVGLCALFGECPVINISNRPTMALRRVHGSVHQSRFDIADERVVGNICSVDHISPDRGEYK